MTDTTGNTDSADRSPADDEDQPKSPAEWNAYWDKELSAAKRWVQKWHAQAHRIESEYLAQAPNQMGDRANTTARYNIFWANVQVLLSNVYTKLPEPEVDRTHLDANDDVARVAGLILERIFKFELKNIEESPDDVYREAIKDRFVTGLGICWPRYEFKEQQVTTPAITHPQTGEEMAPQVVETVITDEVVPLDYVRWEDFLYSPCRTWTERRWVARRAHMSKEKLVARFGATIANQVPLKKGGSIRSGNTDDPMRLSPEPLGEVYEIWCKDHMAVFWFCFGSQTVLDVKPDPLGLTGFWPVKKPLIGTCTSASFMPRPDYIYVQDQYMELHMLATRTKLLTDALKVVGLYDKTSTEIPRLLGQASMNQLIPVDNWAMFAEKGGIKGQVDWLPMEMIVGTLNSMTERKQTLMQEIYEILGLSDIMRGQSVATETATAQQLKAQYGSTRMQRVQNEVAEFITVNTRTRAEIICKHWSPETIVERSQIMQTVDRDLVPAAVQLLKNSSQLALRLTVQADTIAAPDWNQEKQQRIDFLQAISQFIGMSMPLIQVQPGVAPFMIQMMQWAATGFKAGKQIEGIMDQALQALQVSLSQPKPPPPPSARDIKDRASASKSEADAKKANAETMAGLAAAGINPAMLGIIPPHDAQLRGPTQGMPGVQAPPGQGGPGRPPERALPPNQGMQ